MIRPKISLFGVGRLSRAFWWGEGEREKRRREEEEGRRKKKRRRKSKFGTFVSISMELLYGFVG